MDMSSCHCVNPACKEPYNPAGVRICQSCGTQLILNGKYCAIALLGQGGSSRTFVGKSIHTMQHCVIKQRWQHHSTLQQGDNRASQFQQDIHDLNVLRDHPQIAVWIDSFEQDGYFYNIQDYVAGNNLETLLNEKGLFNSSQIWQLLEHLLPVLQFIHSHHIIHRDIRPENIIVRAPSDSTYSVLPSPVLVDFSTAKRVIDLDVTQPEPTIGSAEYAAPEQVKGNAIFASDLYSLGVTCIHLLTGIRPFTLFDSSTNRSTWRSYWSALTNGQLSDVDRRLADVLDQLIDPDLDRRFNSATTAIAAIHQRQGKKMPVAAPVPSPTWVCSATLVGHQGLFASVNGVAIAPQPPLLASASDDKTIRLWNRQTGTEVGVLSGHGNFVKAVAFHPHIATVLASGSSDRTIKLWDGQQQQEIATLTGHTQPIHAVAFSANGQQLASGSADKTIRLWDWQTRQPIVTLSAHLLAVNAIAFSPVEPLLVSASSDCTIRFWDLQTSRLIQTVSDHTAAIRAIAFSPDGRLLATGGDDRTIRLWDVAARCCLQVLSGHSWPVSGLAFSPDGTMLFSSSWDTTIKQWQVSNGMEIAALAGHTDLVTGVAIASDGRAIASSSKDKTLKLWITDPKHD